MAYNEIITGLQVNTGWNLTFNPTGKFPVIAKRAFPTLADAQAYVDDPKSSATAGIVVTVTKDEVAKNNGGALEFTVAGKATVTITVSSTGGSNTSAFALVDATGNAMAEANGLTEVTGTAAITVTYTVEAGIYKIVSPQSDYGRGYRIMSVVVVDGIE